MKTAAIERMKRHVKQVGECLLFVQQSGPNGYGALMTYENEKPVMRLAHRITYEAHFGPIPKGMIVMHSCDNRKCVNPAHLSLGTQRDNLQDMCKRGRHKGKLKVADVLEIRASIESTGALAKRFSVSFQTIWQIRKHKTWASLDEGVPPG